MGGVVVVLDFDKTIIDCDSDNWVVDEFGLTELFAQLLPTLPWNSLMDRMMTELHSRGNTILQIGECLKRAPLHPTVISAIKSAQAFGCDLRIVSDANVFFIETILKHHGLVECFNEITTNPCSVDEEGRLRILPYHDFNNSSHTCKICPPNMCKGVLMEKIRASLSAKEKKQFIYVGDGAADFCAGLKLEEGDFLMPRKNFPIWEMICRNPMLIKSKIQEWSNWEELQSVMLNTIDTFVVAEKPRVEIDNLVPVECKLQDGSISAQPNTLRECYAKSLS
ncbi:hypothetical protein UlMin_034977 [Ulmus minor]